MTTKQMQCTCAHAFQDKTYGKGNRIFNFGGKAWTCTVCSRAVQEAAKPVQAKDAKGKVAKDSKAAAPAKK